MQRNVLALLLQRGRTLRNTAEGRWCVIAPGSKPTPVAEGCARVLLDECAVEPTASLTVRSFTISKRGREAFDGGRW
jgi:hypothetical protein